MFILQNRFLRRRDDGDTNKQLERELADLRDQLFHLARIQLLGSVVGSMAHELSQPLTAVLSNAQAALRLLSVSPQGGAEIRDCLIGIVQSDKRAAEILRRLRLMLREHRTEFAGLSINDVVRESLAILACDMTRRDVIPKICLAPNLPRVDGDRVGLQQVMLNLILNACDAIGETCGERELAISTHATDDGGVEVRVADSGRGILEPDLERIFLPYVTSKPDGTGLGLSICRSIVASHEGAIHASNGSRGAVFHVRLPSRRPALAFSPSRVGV